MPTALSSGALVRLGVLMYSSCKLMLPAESDSKPAMALNSVVLPHPEGPSRQPISPSARANVASETAAIASYCTVTLSNINCLFIAEALVKDTFGNE